MLQSPKNVLYRVPDLTAAREWYRKMLSQEPVFVARFAVVFHIGDSLLTLIPSMPSLAENERTIVYWQVPDIEEAWQQLLTAGATPHYEIRNGLEARVAAVVDPFGNIIGVSAPLPADGPSIDRQPSESARAVAFCRALAAADEREEIRGSDHLAHHFLSADAVRALKDSASREFVRGNMSPGCYQFFIARTAWFDLQVRAALESAVPQIVILGAGYDSRAYRFAASLGGTRLFELDAPPTQDLKKTLLAQAGIAVPPQVTFVAANLAAQSLATVLPPAGYDPSLRTLFVWEGVTYYLPQAAVDATLAFIRSHSAPRSLVAFDYMLDAPDLESRYGVKDTLAAMRAAYAGELRFRIAEGAIDQFLAARGYAAVEHLAPEEMERRFLRLNDGSSAGAVVELFALALAETR